MSDEIYEFKMYTFELGTTEERIKAIINYDKELTGTGTSITMGKYFMITQLLFEALRKYKLPVI